MDALKVLNSPTPTAAFWQALPVTLTHLAAAGVKLHQTLTTLAGLEDLPMQLTPECRAAILATWTSLTAAPSCAPSRELLALQERLATEVSAGRALLAENLRLREQLHQKESNIAKAAEAAARTPVPRKTGPNSAPPPRADRNLRSDNPKPPPGSTAPGARPPMPPIAHRYVTPAQEAATRPPAPAPDKGKGKGPAVAPKTFAAAAASPPAAALPPPPPPKKAVKAPAPKVPPPVAKSLSALPQIVASYGRDPLPPALRTDPNTIRTSVQHALAAIPTAASLTCLGSAWSQKGNLVLTFATGATITARTNILPIVRRFVPEPHRAEVFVQVPTITLQCSNVPTRSEPGAPAYTSEELLSSIRENPQFKGIEFRFPPDWTTPVHLTDAPKSRIAMTICDPTGQVLPGLWTAKNRRVFLFGVPTTLQVHANLPRLLLCRQCWSIGHATEKCRNGHRCDHCAGRHKPENHRKLCPLCKKANYSLEDFLHCPHDPTCATCKGPHFAGDFERCPSLKRYKSQLRAELPAAVGEESPANSRASSPPPVPPVASDDPMNIA